MKIMDLFLSIYLYSVGVSNKVPFVLKPRQVGKIVSRQALLIIS